jgi:hypothetical protein
MNEFLMKIELNTFLSMYFTYNGSRQLSMATFFVSLYEMSIEEDNSLD